MNPFQKAYNWIKERKTPKWLLRLLGIIEEIAVEVFTQIGKEALAYLETEIIRQAKLDIGGREKLDNVVKGFRDKYVHIGISDYALNMAIELLLGKLKKTDILD